MFSAATWSGTGTCGTVGVAMDAFDGTGDASRAFDAALDGERPKGVPLSLEASSRVVPGTGRGFEGPEGRRLPDIVQGINAQE